jgi:uncharacterized protein YecE (DUF72 family)
LIHIGTAGWSIPSAHAAAFCDGGSHLDRYSRLLTATEINSSFYRPHRRQTYARWSQSVPAQFRFSVKAPKRLTHLGALVADEAVIERFATEISGLGPKLGPVLVQMPPSLAFETASASQLFGRLRGVLATQLVCEPRHPSWGSQEAEALLRHFSIARVAADPSRFPGGDAPGGSAMASYFRLHGLPRVYYSEYGAERLATLSQALHRAKRRSAEVWCIFDNTASGCAMADALALLALQSRPGAVAPTQAAASHSA